MLLILAFRHLAVRKARSLVLLAGFAIGVGVMIVLLSVGEAMLTQSRDVALVGGGELTVLPQGIDLEAMRTGGISGMFFGIDRARYVTRQILGGPREAGVIRAVAPVIENKLLYLHAGSRTVVVRAGGEVPSRARAVGAGLQVRTGAWDDSPADLAYVAPTPQQLYDQLDHFHLPAVPDSTWGEWHYFNIVTGPQEWWYVTMLVGGAVLTGRWGGQLIVTHRRSDGRYERFTEAIAPDGVRLDTAAADLALGPNIVRQRGGVYTLSARVPGRLQIDFVLHPSPHRYFPPAELRADAFVSGYVVPALAGTADGRFCTGGVCRSVTGAPAYHDHNWGVWRDVTWEWGVAHGRSLDLLYGGVYAADSAAGGSPFFMAVVDSLGTRQVVRFRTIRYSGSRPTATPGVMSPERFELLAAREADTVRLSVVVEDALATAMGAADFRRYFLQMRGRFVLAGRLAGAAVSDSGRGFFETYIPGIRTR